MENDWLGLASRVVAVTGGGSGIGRQVVLDLAAAGAVPVALDLSREGAEAAADEARAAGASAASALALDVTDPAAVIAAFEAIADRHGVLGGLVNAAGLLRPGALRDLSPSEWELTLKVDLTGCFLTAQAACRLMGAGGAVVHISSIAGTNPQPFSGAYSPSKAGLTMLSRQLAFEWGPDGIRSNVVSPGLVRTPMSEPFYQVPGVLEARENAVPLRRIASAADMADVTLFLLSDRSSYVTGQEIVVDGGFGTGLMSFVPRPGFSD